MILSLGGAVRRRSASRTITPIWWRAPSAAHRAEREIGALMEGDVHLDAPIGAADVEDIECGDRALAKGELDLLNPALVLHERARKAAARGHHDAFGRG